MPEERPESQSYERAHKRVEELRGFYNHLLVYVLIMGGLFLINMLTSREALWFLYPAIGWGIFVVLHAITVFAGGPFGQRWEERKTRQLMEQDEKDRSRWGPRPPQTHVPG